jgi:hypothetical protein
MPHTKVTMMKSRKMTKTWDETDPHNDVIFGRRRSDSVVDDLTNKVLFVLEFKRTSDQRRDYKERGESRAMTQQDILIRSLERVAGDAEGENGGWKINENLRGGQERISACTDFNDSLQDLYLNVKTKEVPRTRYSKGWAILSESCTDRERERERERERTERERERDREVLLTIKK